MIDWRKSMEQSFAFYVVDPATWKDDRQLENVKSCTINRDASNATLGSATIDCTETLEECYVRVYLIARQNGVTERVPLGTFLIQTPGMGFDGKAPSFSLDAYTPLIELKGSLPPIGYTLLGKKPDEEDKEYEAVRIMDVASSLCRENMRAPVIAASSDKTLESNFVSNLSDTWLTFVTDLIANAKYRLGLDELGRVIFEPQQDMGALQSVWTYEDNEVSILYPSISNKRDLYGIPNVVEVVYSTGSGCISSRIVNDDPNSPVSTVNRGREVVYRDSNPSFSGIPDQDMIDAYAVQLLRNLSCLEHTITYSHGYCPVRINDCVTLNYRAAGLVNVKAKVISQSISCATSCKVEETAVYTTKLWR